MFLCLDIGNSHLCGGVFDSNRKLLLQFRYNCKHIGSSDELGIFLRSVLRENNIPYEHIKKIGISSVVPSLDYTTRAACVKYFKLEPKFLDNTVVSDIKICTENPQALGADLLAGAVAAKQLISKRDVLIFDFGTATTSLYVDADNNLLGTAITPGVKIMMESLHNNTAKLCSVEIITTDSALGINTQTAIQSGIFNSQMGFINETISGVMTQYKLESRPYIIGTGGFAYLFNNHSIFNCIVPELVLLGVLWVIL
jgi:type III pantothenate kinase